ERERARAVVAGDGRERRRPVVLRVECQRERVCPHSATADRSRVRRDADATVDRCALDDVTAERSGTGRATIRVDGEWQGDRVDVGVDRIPVRLELPEEVDAGGRGALGAKEPLPGL